jgi:hypothetical protein
MKNNSSSGIHMFCLGLRGSLEIEGAIARHVILKKRNVFVDVRNNLFMEKYNQAWYNFNSTVCKNI